MFTSDNLSERSKRNPQERYTLPNGIVLRKVVKRRPFAEPLNPQERYTLPKRIDLRKVAKLRPFEKPLERRVSSPTHTRSDSYPANEEQCLPQPSQPSILDSGWLFHLESYLVLSADFDILSF